MKEVKISKFALEENAVDALEAIVDYYCELADSRCDWIKQLAADINTTMEASDNTVRGFNYRVQTCLSEEEQEILAEYFTGVEVIDDIYENVKNLNDVELTKLTYALDKVFLVDTPILGIPMVSDYILRGYAFAHNAEAWANVAKKAAIEKDNATTGASSEYYQRRVDELGLPSLVVAMLVLNRMFTVGDILAYSKEELSEIIGIDNATCVFEAFKLNNILFRMAHTGEDVNEAVTDWENEFSSVSADAESLDDGVSSETAGEVVEP